MNISALRTANGEDSVGKTTVTIVGMGEGGFRELGGRAQHAIIDADLIVGSWRHLGALPDNLTAEKRPWQSVSHVPEILAEHDTSHIVIVDQGDPSLMGMAAVIAQRFPDIEYTVIPHVSAPSLACARLGWELSATRTYTVRGDDLSPLVIALDKGARFLIFADSEQSVHLVAEMLRERDQSDATIVTLSDLGGVDESLQYGTAAHPPQATSGLYMMAVVPSALGQSLLPGLSDSNYNYVHNNKYVRALSICALRPRDTDTLWSVGGGALAIEFLRATENSRAICFEHDDLIQQSLLSDSRALGVSRRIAIQHGAPAAFDDVPDTPDVVFLQATTGNDSIITAAWMRLRDGGRMVVNSDEFLDLTSLNSDAEKHRFSIDTVDGATHQFYQWVATKPQSPERV